MVWFYLKKPGRAWEAISCLQYMAIQASAPHHPDLAEGVKLAAVYSMPEDHYEATDAH